MSFNFKNLDQSVRELMIKEVELDELNNNLYLSKRFTSQGAQAYPSLLKEAIKNGNEVTLASSLNQPAYFNSEEVRQTKNGPVTARIPEDAATTLAEGEFNRFYMRAVATVALSKGLNVKVYRAKQVTNARSASEQMIGKSVNASELLQSLRSEIGTDTALGLPAGPNSGLSLEI